MRNVKRSAVIVNTIMFIALSLCFLSVIVSLEKGISALDLAGFTLFLKSHKLLLWLGGGTIFSVLLLMRVSPLLYIGFCLSILYQSFSVFLIDFDKLILILNFTYIVLSYNFYLFLKLELKEPYYNPRYPANIIPIYESKLLPIKIKRAGVEFDAHLTNWGMNGFFCKIDSDSTIRGRVEIEALLEGHSFYLEGDVVTSRPCGIGVRVTKSPIPDMGWNDYYNIVSELGYRPLS